MNPSYSSGFSFKVRAQRPGGLGAPFYVSWDKGDNVFPLLVTEDQHKDLLELLAQQDVTVLSEHPLDNPDIAEARKIDLGPLPEELPTLVVDDG